MNAPGDLLGKPSCPKMNVKKSAKRRKPVFTLIRTEKCMYYHPVSLFLKGIEIPNRNYVVCKLGTGCTTQS